MMADDAASEEQALSRLLIEERVFQPPADFAAAAVVQDASVYERAEAAPEAFWAEMAEQLDWYEKWDEVLRWDPPHAEWSA